MASIRQTIPTSPLRTPAMQRPFLTSAEMLSIGVKTQKRMRLVYVRHLAVASGATWRHYSCVTGIVCSIFCAGSEDLR